MRHQLKRCRDAVPSKHTIASNTCRYWSQLDLPAYMGTDVDVNSDPPGVWEGIAGLLALPYPNSVREFRQFFFQPRYRVNQFYPRRPYLLEILVLRWPPGLGHRWILVIRRPPQLGRKGLACVGYPTGPLPFSHPSQRPSSSPPDHQLDVCV